MLTLKDLLTVCRPDWIEVGSKYFEVRRHGIPGHLLTLSVKDITGFDDGLTIELVDPGQ